MSKKNSRNLTTWKTFIRSIKDFIKPISNSFNDFNQKYPNVNQMIQLTFIFFFAIVDLHFAILNNVLSLGYVPDILKSDFPAIKSICQSPFFKIWASPEKVFFLSYVTIELAIIRKVFGFSKLVRYNILLIFSLLMIQGLTISYWDLLFNRTISGPVIKWVLDQGLFLNQDKSIAIFFFVSTYILFMVIYTYLYICATKGKFSSLPYMEWLFDSIAFWVKIKTPSMRYGKDGQKNNSNENKKE